MRCYSDYYQGELTSQKRLLILLEKKKFENEGKRLLTTKSVGIPITIYFLLLKEAINVLIDEQKNMLNDHKVICEMNTDTVIADYSLSVKESFNENINCVNSWELNSVWFQPDSPMLSGCPVYETTDVLVPNLSNDIDLKDLFESSDDGIDIYKSVIKVEPSIKKQKPMINIYKHIFSSVEYFYSISQRIQSEVKNFNQIFGCSIAKPIINGDFNSFCTRRTDLIHKGNLSLNIKPENSRLFLNESELIPSLEKGLKEAIKAVDESYKHMIFELENQRNKNRDE